MPARVNSGALLGVEAYIVEVLRQPLEECKVIISRAATALTYPARFMLVAAMNH